jgi:hypothetical protein
MAIQLFDPVGEVERRPAREAARLTKLEGSAWVAFSISTFRQSRSGRRWKRDREDLQPAKISRVYKSNTWAPAPRVDALRLLDESDYVLVGSAPEGPAPPAPCATDLFHEIGAADTRLRLMTPSSARPCSGEGARYARAQHLCLSAAQERRFRSRRSRKGQKAVTICGNCSSTVAEAFA